MSKFDELKILKSDNNAKWRANLEERVEINRTRYRAIAKMHKISKVNAQIEDELGKIRVESLQQTIAFLKEHSMNWYTAKDLVAILNLDITPQHLGTLISCRHPSRIKSKEESQPITYARINPDGTIDFNSTITYTNKINKYSYNY